MTDTFTLKYPKTRQVPIISFQDVDTHIYTIEIFNEEEEVSKEAELNILLIAPM